MKSLAKTNLIRRYRRWLTAIAGVAIGISTVAGSHVHFWKYNTGNPDGSPVDVSRRSPLSRQLSRQLTKEKDAKLISDYGNPTFVLGGWKPALAKKSIR